MVFGTAIWRPLVYYYDTHTGWYNLKIRYYDPMVGRFINSDDRMQGVGGDIRGYNLYAYCFNNPINMEDQDGHWPKWVKKFVKSAKKWIKKSVNSVKRKVNPIVYAASKKSSHYANRRPNTGKPGSTWRAPNGDTRTYGPDNKPIHDYDHDDHGQPNTHPHDENGGHNHDWDWSKTPPRGKPYASNWEPIAGAGLVTICAIGIIVIAADDATGVGVVDDFLFAPLGAGVTRGLIMMGF